MPSQSLSDIKFEPAQGYDALYFRRLFAKPDSLPSEGDSDYDALRKKELQLSRMLQIAQGIKEPWFRYFEEVLVARLDDLNHLIWSAIRDQSDKIIFKLSVERHGIMSFFEMYKNLSQGIATLQEEIEELKLKLESPTVSDDPVAEGHNVL